MDYQVEQEMELEALESILMEDFEGTPLAVTIPVCVLRISINAFVIQGIMSNHCNSMH